MKKTNIKNKLQLRLDTLRGLTPADLQRVVGGASAKPEQTQRPTSFDTYCTKP